MLGMDKKNIVIELTSSLVFDDGGSMFVGGLMSVRRTMLPCLSISCTTKSEYLQQVQIRHHKWQYLPGDNRLRPTEGVDGSIALG